MELSAQQTARIEARLKEIDALPCPACRRGQRRVEAFLTRAIAQDTENSMDMTTGMACATTTCPVCGFVGLHALNTLGLSVETLRRV